MLRANRLLVVIVAGASLIAACSDSKGSALNLATSQASTSAPRTTTATAATTTDAPESTTTTTGPTASTPLPSEEEQVKADYLRAFAARKQCNFDPEGCEYGAIAIPGSPTDKYTRATMKTRVDDHLYAREGNGDAVVRVETASVSGDTATVATCYLDTLILFDVADPTDTTDDIVFNEVKESARVRWNLRRLNGSWLLYDGVDLEALTGGDLCGF